MNVINIISFLMIVLAAGYLLRESLGDMLPFVWSVLIAVLYVLAFGRILNIIDVLLPAAAVGLTALAVYRVRSSEPGSAAEYIRSGISAGVIAYLILCITLPIFLHRRIVTWWDDVNFWAVDLKSLYYLGGFARKYANVAPEFGDYPPAVQLAKWFAVHMDRRAFREDLAFCGYQLFNLSFLMPLFTRLRGRRALWGIPLAAAAWCFAGMGEIFGYSGFCADLSMALLFGSVLTEAVRYSQDECGKPMSFIRPALYLAILVLCKSTGFIWALFGAILFICIRLRDMTDVTKRRILSVFSVLIGPAVTGGSWMLFCLIRHRVARTTSTMVTYITTDDYALSPYRSEFAQAYLRAFFTEPVHIDHTWIDLPPFFMLILITVLLAVFVRLKYIHGRSARLICIGLPVTGLLYYTVIFIAHVTIFATETQYLEPEGMITSISRYGAPFVLGCLLFISYIWMHTDDSAMRVRVFVVAVLALTNLPAAFDGLIGYTSALDEDLETRESFIEEDSEIFLKVIAESPAISDRIDSGGVRVCRVRDGAYYRVADTYVAYAASPVSVMSFSTGIRDIDEETFVRAVSDTHAEYLYVDDQPYTGTYLDPMTPDGIFKYATLYRIAYEGGMMKLYE